MMKEFNARFWKATSVAGVMGFGTVAALTVFASASNPPKPAFPLSGNRCLSAYSFGHADHYVFRFGLFGAGERIRNADVLIVGSSHAIFGLSAERIAAALSERWGRRVTAFNMSLGFGDGMGFVREILQKNELHGKILLLDLFSNDRGRPSEVALRAMQTDILGAYVSVATTVTDFVRDWLIDGWLPRIYFGSRTVSLAARAQQPASASLSAERSLGVVVIRRCDNADLEEIWFPEHGGVFRNTPAHMVSGLDADSQSPRPSPTLAPEYEAYLRSADFRVALTLIPYDGYRVEEAKRAAEQIGRPFIEVDPIDLKFWDLNHLIAESRDLASLRVVERWSAPEGR
jgi:hypothetical protein